MFSCISTLRISGGSASDYNAAGRGFAPHTVRSFIGSPNLNGYWSLTGYLTEAEKLTGYSTPPCRRPRIMGAVTAPSATIT